MIHGTGDRYLDSYCGAWAIDGMYANSLLATAQALNFAEHRATFVESVNAGPGTRAGSGAYRGTLTPDGVAILQVRGTLMKSQSSLGSSTGTVAVRSDVRDAAADPRVRGIMLQIESPGGTVAGTAELADDVKAAGATKPTWAFCDDLMASAAYWVGSQAARIGANRTSLVGSLGTIMVIYDVSKKFESAGVTPHVFATGPFKSAGTPGTPVTLEQRKHFQSMIDETNGHFVEQASAGRGRNLRHLFDGKIHGATTAKAAGLIDDVTSFDSFYGQFVDRLSKPAAGSAAAEAVVAASHAHQPWDRPHASGKVGAMVAAQMAEREFALNVGGCREHFTHHATYSVHRTAVLTGRVDGPSGFARR